MTPDKRNEFYNFMDSVLNNAQAAPLATVLASNYMPENAIKKLQAHLKEQIALLPED